MKKNYLLLKACMTNDMNIFKIKEKKDNKKSFLPIILSIFFMFAIWANANIIFEKLAPLKLQSFALAIVVFSISVMTIIEGVYKTGPLLFKCRDDQLLFSLPIKKQTILFIRVFKFYIFELMFNSLFIIPLIITYSRWADNLDWTFFLTSFVMLIMLPIVPIAVSCIIGFIITNISSRFKYKNLIQIIVSMLFLSVILGFSFYMDKLFDIIAKHATSINDFIIKLYYPAGVYAKLVSNFNIIDLLIFIIVNICIFSITIFVLSKFYFKINSKLNVSTSNKIKIDDLSIKKSSVVISLIKKEFNTFFKTPVFIVNAGFSLVLYLMVVIGLSIKYDSVITIFNSFLSSNGVIGNMPILILILLIATSFMTSITNSVISLEGKNINIIKSLPVKTKTILLSKIYAALLITTFPILLGDLIIFLRFRLSIVEMILLILLSIIIPLISHFIGLIINLKYPKLDYDNSAEVVKQSISSFICVSTGMLLLIISIFFVVKLTEYFTSFYILLLFLGIYLIIDIVLYLYLINVSVKDFNKLQV